MLRHSSGSFFEGCGIMVWDENDNLYHLIVHKEKETEKLFVEIGKRRYYEEDIANSSANMQTVKEFLKGTRNCYHVNITQGTNDNVVFDGTYAELKANAKELLKKVVVSWDATPMADGTTDIGIMI